MVASFHRVPGRPHQVCSTAERPDSLPSENILGVVGTARGFSVRCARIFLRVRPNGLPCRGVRCRFLRSTWMFAEAESRLRVGEWSAVVSGGWTRNGLKILDDGSLELGCAGRSSSLNSDPPVRADQLPGPGFLARSMEVSALESRSLTVRASPQTESLLGTAPTGRSALTGSPATPQCGYALADQAGSA